MLRLPVQTIQPRQDGRCAEGARYQPADFCICSSVMPAHTHSFFLPLSFFLGFALHQRTNTHTASTCFFFSPFYASVLPLGQQPMSANECKNSYQSAVCTIQPLLPSWCQVTSTSLFLERFKVETLKRLNFSSGWSSDSFWHRVRNAVVLFLHNAQVFLIGFFPL